MSIIYECLKNECMNVKEKKNGKKKNRQQMRSKLYTYFTNPADYLY